MAVNLHTKTYEESYNLEILRQLASIQLELPWCLRVLS